MSKQDNLRAESELGFGRRIVQLLEQCFLEAFSDARGAPVSHPLCAALLTSYAAKVLRGAAADGCWHEVVECCLSRASRVATRSWS
jgi:hypothetical protein